MGNLTIATVFIVFVNALMILTQVAILGINPAGSRCYDSSASLIGKSLTGTNLSNATVNNDFTTQIPGASSAVGVGTTNDNSNIFNTILSWVKSVPGLKLVYEIVAAPGNVISCMGLPNEFNVIVGGLWYVISLLLVVVFLRSSD